MNRKTQLTLGDQNDKKFLLSTIPSTQEDIKQLEERFHMMLYKESALEIGLCSKRRRIYDDLFTELIRITKIHCLERGLLLERIKNEHIQWMNTYEELYSSSMAYSIRQYLYKNEEKKHLEDLSEILENDCQQLHNEIEQESIKYQELTKQTNKNEDNQTDLKFLQSTNKKLHYDLEKILNQILTSTIFLGRNN